MNKKNKLILIYIINLILALITNWLIFILGIFILPIPMCLYYQINKNISEINNDEEYEIPIENDNRNVNEFKYVVEECFEKNNEINEFKRNVDLEKFKDRNDVTKEEVINYILNHHKFEGFFKMCMRTEMICSSCNLDENDRNEIRKILYKLIPFNEDKEKQIIAEYEQSKRNSFYKEYEGKRNENEIWLKERKMNDIWQIIENNNLKGNNYG